MNKIETSTHVFILILSFISFTIYARTEPFILGADISWVPEEEASGAKYYDDNTKQDIFTILKNHKFNYIRLRIFNDPTAASGGSESTTGAVYSGYSSNGYCDPAHTKAMALRIANAGMKFCIDFHYSDNWADPGKQYKPHAWASADSSALVDSVRYFTKNILTALKAQGTLPSMVQVGNEITAGMIWPDGNMIKNGWPEFIALIKAGIAGVKDVDSSIKIMIHIDKGGNYQTTKWWLDNAIAQGLEFDILGQSCYTSVQGKPSTWKTCFDSLVKNYPGYSFIIAEYSEDKRAANDIMFNLPDERGLGTFIWEPVQWLEKIFDQSGTTYTTIDSLIDLYPQMYLDYGNDTFTTAIKKITDNDNRASICIRNASAWLCGKGPLEFYSPVASKASINVFNCLGEKCSGIHINAQKGLNKIYNSESSDIIRNGVYVISVKIGDATFSEKIFNR
jgi:arabinogalactan endo-1,4-beta-galactosidase